MEGVYPATVVDVRDPEGLGRVKVALPSRDGSARRQESWARLSTLMAGPRTGTWFVPDVNDEVLVAFEAGDARRPYVIGSLWSPKRPPPHQMDAAGENSLKLLKTRSGITITLDDRQGDERLVLATPGGQSIVMTSGAAGIELADGNGNEIRLEPSGVTIRAAARVTMQAPQVSIEAPLVECAGSLRADSVITNSVVSASYTPGAGNVW